MNHKSEENSRSLLRDEDFSCSLDVLYGGLGIFKIFKLLIKKIQFFFSCKILDLDPDPDPH
jgi:hypothetical protein